jgi:hypothetical protein
LIFQTLRQQGRDSQIKSRFTDEVQVTHITIFSKLVINVYTAKESKEGQNGLKLALPPSNIKMEVFQTNINNTDDLILQMI